MPPRVAHVASAGAAALWSARERRAGGRRVRRRVVGRGALVGTVVEHDVAREHVDHHIDDNDVDHLAAGGDHDCTADRARAGTRAGR